MKRTYLAKRNTLFSTHGFLRSVAFVGVILFVVLFRFTAPDLFWKVCAPIFNMSSVVAAKTHQFLSGFGDTASLTAQNEMLTKQNAALANENRTLMLKLNVFAGLGNTISKMPPGIFAGVVARPPESPYDTLRLASGINDSVKIGMEVFDNGGVPIGVVTSVQTDFSQVTLFSSPGIVTDGWVGPADTPLTLHGAGGGAFAATVPRAANIATGDIVSVPGPGMLPIGTVVQADSDPLSPSVILRIAPTANLFTLGWVELRMTGITVPEAAPLMTL